MKHKSVTPQTKISTMMRPAEGKCKENSLTFTSCTSAFGAVGTVSEFPMASKFERGRIGGGWRALRALGNVNKEIFVITLRLSPRCRLSVSCLGCPRGRSKCLAAGDW